MSPIRSSLLACLASLTLASSLAAAEQAPNTLTDAERAAGWRLLFDGRTTTGWRGYKQNDMATAGWLVQDGCLHHPGKSGGKDIITLDKFEDYELTWQWKINAGGNSGLKYFVIEDRPDVIGHEYQIMGETGPESVRKDPKHATGSFYDVLPVNTDLPLRTPGSWNESRLILRGNHVEHWLNDKLVVSYELGSDAVKAGIAASKFRRIERFGTRFPHHILLQEHGGDVSFRNIKLKPLAPK